MGIPRPANCAAKLRKKFLMSALRQVHFGQEAGKHIVIKAMERHVTNGRTYHALILSTNSLGVKISIFEKPNHFFPRSLMEAPM